MRTSVRTLTSKHFHMYVRNVREYTPHYDHMRHTLNTTPELYLLGNVDGDKIVAWDLMVQREPQTLPTTHDSLHGQYVVLTPEEAAAYLKKWEERTSHEIETFKAFIENLETKRKNCARVRRTFG
mgnify:FL=1